METQTKISGLFLNAKQIRIFGLVLSIFMITSLFLPGSYQQHGKKKQTIMMIQKYKLPDMSNIKKINTKLEKTFTAYGIFLLIFAIGCGVSVFLKFRLRYILGGGFFLTILILVIVSLAVNSEAQDMAEDAGGKVDFGLSFGPFLCLLFTSCYIVFYIMAAKKPIVIPVNQNAGQSQIENKTIIIEQPQQIVQPPQNPAFSPEFCINCGIQLKPNANFCHICTKPVIRRK